MMVQTNKQNNDKTIKMNFHYYEEKMLNLIILKDTTKVAYLDCHTGCYLIKVGILYIIND